MCPHTPASRVGNPPTPADEPLPCSSKKKKGPDGPHAERGGDTHALAKFRHALSKGRAALTTYIKRRCIERRTSAEVWGVGRRRTRRGRRRPVSGIGPRPARPISQ